MVADYLLCYHLRHLRDVQLSDEQVLFVQEREEELRAVIVFPQYAYFTNFLTSENERLATLMK